jgi:hypothetical protein
MNAIHRFGLDAGLTTQDETALVLSRTGRDIAVLRHGEPQDARLAFSCLVAPEQGDQVLTAEADGRLWVLAVLERPVRETNGPTLLVAEGDLTIASTGTLRMAAATDIAVDAGATARISGREVEVHASVLRSVAEEVLHVGKRITAHVTTVRTVADLIESFAEHLLQRARRSTRIIEQTDHLRSADIDHAATNTLQLQAKQAFVSADTVVRIDAAQIHMG